MIEPDVVVVASGPGPAVAVPAGATVVAADGGVERAIALGLDVDVVIGDLDSASEDALAAAELAGARIVRPRSQRTPPTWSSRSTRLPRSARVACS